MSFRIVNGNTHTEDGWRCCNRDECDIVRIPELFLTDTAPLRKGPPLVILGAWLFWYDRNVEEIVSSVWGWSETNDVLGRPGKNDGSNHLSATAVDVNAPKYPWGKRVMPADRIAKIREGQRIFEDSIFWGEDWDRADQMHFQLRWPEGDPRNEAFAQKLLGGYLGIYGAPPPVPQGGYGVPAGSQINYGAPGFPDWVYQLGNAFGLRASTYPGHQETDRNEAGFAPNPQHLNRGIDWNGSVENMQRFAEYCLSIRGSIEQVIWQNPNTGQRVGVAGGKDVTNTPYYASDYGGHTDHVHTRQSAPIPIPGAPPPPPPPPPPHVDAAEVLASATGITLVKATWIVDQVSFALIRSNCTNPRRIAAALAQWVIESGHFRYTEEIADGPEDQERWKYKGRTWIQLTWLENYKGFSEWCHSLGLVPTPDYFVIRPRELAEQKWAALGPAYWWAIKYPQINEYADRGDIDNVSKWVNAPAWVDDPNRHANGEAERREAYNQALELGDQLLALITDAPPAPPPGEDDWLNMPSNQEKLDAIYNALITPQSPENIYREANDGVGQNLIDSIRSTLSMTYEGVVERLALLGEQASIDKVVRVARGEGPEQRPWAIERAKLIWARGRSGSGTPPPVTPAPLSVITPTQPALPAVIEPEVLPPLHETTVMHSGSQDTPQAMLDGVHEAVAFRRDLNKAFDDAWTDQSTGEHSK